MHDSGQHDGDDEVDDDDGHDSDATFPEFRISENPSVPSGNPPEIRRTENFSAPESDWENLFSAPENAKLSNHDAKYYY